MHQKIIMETESKTQKTKLLSDLVVGLDIGTTKICAIIGGKNEFGKVEIFILYEMFFLFG